MEELAVYIVGECMVELQRSPGHTGTMDVRFGGDTLNAAVYLARLLGPARVAYVTGLGVDGMSDDMCAAWEEEGVDTACVVRLPDKLPGMYLIETDDRGERRFHYWRSDSAARHWLRAPEAATVLQQLGSAATLCLSGISLAILAPADRDRMLGVMAQCRSAGGTVVFDNNYRPRLWDSIETARTVYRAALAHTSIALLTLDDEVALYGLQDGPMDAEAVVARTRALGVPEVVVKCGAEPCVVWADGRLDVVAAPPVAHVVDTTAAGDAFGAAYLAARLQGRSGAQAAAAGHRLAAAVIGQRGAIIAREKMPGS
jgi:2-dehydro-3-deoxygluconokinase